MIRGGGRIVANMSEPGFPEPGSAAFRGGCRAGSRFRRVCRSDNLHAVSVAVRVIVGDFAAVSRRGVNYECCQIRSL